jgi:hypothetical protein
VSFNCYRLYFGVFTQTPLSCNYQLKRDSLENRRFQFLIVEIVCLVITFALQVGAILSELCSLSYARNGFTGKIQTWKQSSDIRYNLEVLNGSDCESILNKGLDSLHGTGLGIILVVTGM